MVGFPHPAFDYAIDVEREREVLRTHRLTRAVPEPTPDALLLATWNVANLGAHEQAREPACFELLAEIVAFFDLVALQEVRDDVHAGVRQILERLPDSWRLLFSETGGNDERMAFLWNSAAADQGQLVGKVTIEPADLVAAGGEGFQGFSRTPYVGTFHRSDLALELVSVHSYYGSASDPEDMARRLAETRAIAWWSEHAAADPQAYTRDVLALGDFNTPSADDSEYAAALLAELSRRGLIPPPVFIKDGQEHTVETQIGTAVRSENHYDQLLFFPNNTEADLMGSGVFDFDAVVFAELWKERSHDDFNDFVVWALSDHRPMWAQFKAPEAQD